VDPGAGAKVFWFFFSKNNTASFCFPGVNNILHVPQRAALRPVRLGGTGVKVEAHADGVHILRAEEALAPHPAFMTDALDDWAARAPDRVFLTQCEAAGGRRAITYAETRAAVRAIAQALAERGLSGGKPLAILSENSIDAALLTLAGQYAGVPVVPISPPYALLSKDFERLRRIMQAVQPALVFAADAAYAPALAATVPDNIDIVIGHGVLPDRRSVALASLRGAVPGAALEGAQAARRPDDVAKLLFTSGSTGTPKGVINTHAMLTSNQQMIRQMFAFLEDEPPVLVDWLPWHHTFGGNHNFGIALYNGGTLHIDAGRPTPAGIARTVAALREFAPTLYFNVPRGFDMVLVEIERDPLLAANFFSRVKLLYYAGAALSPPCWNGLIEAAIRSCGERVLMLTGLGSTETGPFALAAVRDADRPGEIGIPAPGTTVKLVPNGQKLELRLRSPSVMRGYWNDPAQTAAAFDEEGFYRIGDAVRFAHPGQPALGLRFDGRIAEDFKLATGTWVNVGALRARVLTECAPFIQEAVMIGHDRAEAGALVVPNHAACAAHFGDHGDAALEAWLRDRLVLLKGGSSSDRVTRLAILRRPLSLDDGEITDKGSVNARRVVEIRADVIEACYAHDGIIWEAGKKEGLLF
jgi:feruloyl-CoA synthase